MLGFALGAEEDVLKLFSIYLSLGVPALGCKVLCKT